MKTSTEAVSEIPDPGAKDKRLSRLSCVPRQLYRRNKEESATALLDSRRLSDKVLE